MNITDNYTADEVEEECNTFCQERHWTFWIEGVCVPVIAMFGILGNIICVFVFNQKGVELKPSFSNILKCLSIFDTLFLAGVVWLYTLPILFTEFNLYLEPLTTPIVLPLTQMALTGSVYSVLAVALERYFTICKPFQSNMGSIMEGYFYIIIIVMFSILYNVARFFEYKTIYQIKYDNATNTSYEEVSLALTDLRKTPAYTTVCTIFNTAFVGIIPIVTLSVLNYQIIKSMKKANNIHNRISTNQRRDGAMTALLSGVVLVLVLCHTPKTIINVFESYQMLVWGELKYQPLWARVLIKLSHLLLTVSSAVNILIYSYKDIKFRGVLSSFGPKVVNFFHLRVFGTPYQGPRVSNNNMVGEPTNLELATEMTELGKRNRIKFATRGEPV